MSDPISIAELEFIKKDYVNLRKKILRIIKQNKQLQQEIRKLRKGAKVENKS